MAQGHVQRVKLLYKTILKLHRGLPPELQILGNSYAKDEFKRHKNCNTAEAAVFMNEWTVSMKHPLSRHYDLLITCEDYTGHIM